MCTLFYHSSATQSAQVLSTHSINRFCCHQPLSLAFSLYPVQSLFFSDLSEGSWWQPNGHSYAQQVFRLSTAQDNVHLVHEAKNVATQASLIHLVKPKEAVHSAKSLSWRRQFKWEYSKHTASKKLGWVCGRVLILCHNGCFPSDEHW